MKRSFAVAACAAITLGLAACGDDDDDDGAALVTVADDTTPGTADEASTATDAGAGTDAAPGSPELEADCQAFDTFFEEEAETSALDGVDVGDEITDEHRQEIDGLIGQLEDLDLQSDEGQAARRELVNFLESVRDADTFTEDIDQADAAALEALAEGCAPFFANG